MLEATIGLNEVETEAEEPAATASEDADGPFTRSDLTFLKSLRISLSDSTEQSTEDTPETPEA
jgi:hypothetical protein